MILPQKQSFTGCNVCNKKVILTINMTTLNVTMLKQCNNLYIGGIGGYIGYSLCSKLFVCDNYHGINLHIFHALFPNLAVICVHELIIISDEFLHSIYEFLKENRHLDIQYIELNVVKANNNVSDLELK